MRHTICMPFAFFIKHSENVSRMSYLCMFALPLHRNVECVPNGECVTFGEYICIIDTNCSWVYECNASNDTAH